MVSQITRGIKISVKTVYSGTVYHRHQLCYAFSYFITIENTSSDTVQLLGRFWMIFDSLNDTEMVEGEGVVGQTPILPPNSQYNYQSNCFLLSSCGAMSGHYKMINTETNETFLVKVPCFQLASTCFLN